MITFDVKASGSRNGKGERVAIIGSCRVRTPILTLKDLGRLTLNLTKPPLTHTFNDGRQNIRHASGEARIPDELAPYIFESAGAPAADGYPPDLLERIDTFIVEMCDAKQIRYRDFYFQGNYFARNFVQRHAAQLLEWYRTFSKGLPVTETIIRTALDKLAAAGVVVDETTESILRETRMDLPNRDDIIAQADRLVFDRSKRSIFLSHFSIPGDEGPVMRDRRRLAADVEAAAKVVGAEFFDPTRLIEHYGRKAVLRADGADIYEYGWDFIPIVGEILLNIVHQGTGPDLTLPPLAAPSAPPVKTGAAPAPKPTSKGQMVNDHAQRVNKLLINLHRDRLEQLGLEKSGLYDHFRRMLDEGIMVRQREVMVAKLVADELPAYSQYVVMKAGLGSLAMMLALNGADVTAYEQNQHRVAAIEAVISRLQVTKRSAAERLQVKRGVAPTVSVPPSTLGIAVGFVIGTNKSDDAAVIEALARFDALLVEPRTFIRARETAHDQAQAVAALKAAGFGHVRELPSGLMLLSKGPVAAAAAPVAAIAEPAAAK